MLDQKIVHDVLEKAMSRGADFAEIFAEETIANSIVYLNQRVERSTSGVDFGAGVRLFYGTKSIYVFTNDLSRDSLMNLAGAAAQADASERRTAVQDLRKLNVKSPHIVSVYPDTVAKSDKVELLKQVDRGAREQEELIAQVEASYADVKQHVFIANSEGLMVEDERVRTRISANAIAARGNEKQSGYHAPGTFGGFEFYDKVKAVDVGREAARIAGVMIRADYAPKGTMPVIIDNGFGGVIFHEACGHSLETTSVARNASVFAGKLGQQIASEVVTAIDDGTIPNEWGSTVIDDEGAPTQKTVLIENGILKSYMIDKLGGRKVGLESTGSGRRQSYQFAPTSRMRNTYIAAGKSTLEEMLATVKNGLYAKKMGGGSVMPGTGKFNFSVLEGYIIENGKICKPVRGATLIGDGAEVLKKIEMVGDNLAFAQGVCGSESGGVPTNVGQPAIKVSEILVGGR